jgi:hypothetical protein
MPLLLSINNTVVVHINIDMYSLQTVFSLKIRTQANWMTTEPRRHM